MKIRLVRPTEQLKEQAINFRQEFFDNHEMVINGSELLDKTDQYEDWLKAVAANTRIETVNANWVVTDTFFAVDENGKMARQKNLCKRREAVVKETGANQRISQAGHSPA